MASRKDERAGHVPDPRLAFPHAHLDYRRRIVITPGAGTVSAEMEDYIHHFALRIEHRDGVVVAAIPDAVRYPWSTCIVGAAGLASMVGVPLAAATDRRAWAQDRSSQCVHVVDLALLAARHAHDPVPLTYEIRLSPSATRHRTATLHRDGRVLFRWALDGDVITDAGPEGGVALSGDGFFAWVAATMDGADREAAVVLRRACGIGIARGLDMDAYDSSGQLNEPDESCYTHRATVAWRATRMRGTSRATEDEPVS